MTRWLDIRLSHDEAVELLAMLRRDPSPDPFGEASRRIDQLIDELAQFIEVGT